MRYQLDHIGIAVRELEGSVAFYQAVFGFTLSGTDYVREQHAKIAMLSPNAVPEGTKLELLEATDHSSTLAKFMRASGAGLHHLALRVDNLEEALSSARAHGLEAVGAPQRGFGGSRFIFLHPRSTGGVLLELLQREPQEKD